MAHWASDMVLTAFSEEMKVLMHDSFCTLMFLGMFASAIMRNCKHTEQMSFLILVVCRDLPPVIDPTAGVQGLLEAHCLQ